MARRKKSKKSRSQRVSSSNTTRNKRVLRSRYYIKKQNLPRLRKEHLLDDLRRFKPELVTPYLTNQAKDAKIERQYNGHYEKYAFIDPLRTMVCVRRRLRKRMIFRYLNKSGKGGGIRRLKLHIKPRILNPTSYIKC